jgi:small subunit ribosomal protein S16
MAVKIRLRMQGSVNRAMYRIVVADSQLPRDGKYLEEIGWYNPRGKDLLKINVKPDRLQYWLSQGAEMSERVASLMKGAAPEIYNEWHKKQVARHTKKVSKGK